MRKFCGDCGHLASKHEGSAGDEFAISHGGVGYTFCEEIIRTGEGADICGCRLLIGASSDQARGRLWPTDRPTIATIPAPGAPLERVRIISTEVTTTDPLNGQPDFERVEITYVSTDRLIDTKSLKAYWLWWRSRGASMERFSALVAQDIELATGAASVEVTVSEAPRGGISIEATASVALASRKQRSGRDDRNGHASSTDGLRPLTSALGSSPGFTAER